MHKPKILFFDIDGTLIDMQKKCITPLMLSTLHKLQANGIRLAIANGSDALKAAATDICGACAEDGIYHYCVEHGLIEA